MAKIKDKFADSQNYPESKLTEIIISCAFRVFNELKYGLSEKMYQRALGKELNKRGLGLKKEKYGLIKFDNEVVGKYFVDFIVEDKVAVEMKVRSEIFQKDINQLLNYIKSEKLTVGLLLAFSKDGVKIKRLVNKDQR